jgi:hypothetical protein
MFVVRGPGFVTLLLGHLISVLIGFGSCFLTGAYALGALSGVRRGWISQGTCRYFQPGSHWAGRVLYLVPLFGVGLVLDSKGAYGFSDPWIIAGIVAWVVAVGIAHALLWPAQERIERLLAALRGSSVEPQGVLSTSNPSMEQSGGAPILLLEDTESREALRRESRRAVIAAGLLGLVFLFAVVMMTAKP